MAAAFVDSNVLLYAVDRSEPAKREIARRVLAEGVGNLVISAQVLGEFYTTATRKLGIPEAKAAEEVERLSPLAIAAIDAQLVQAGIAISRDSQTSYWDGLIIAAAQAGGCDRLLTEDLNHGQTFGSVRIENPFLD